MAGLDARFGKGFRRRDARDKPFLFSGSQRDDFDFGVERLAERGQNGDPAQAGGVRGKRRC
jgi:hypothetical protein